MTTTTVTIKGLDEVGRALAEFPEVIAKKYLRKATFSAAQTIAAAAAANANAAPRYQAAMQQIAKNVAVFRRTTESPGIAHYAVGVRRVKLSAKVKKTLRILRRAGQSVRIENDTFFWHWYEFGTAPRQTKKGAFRGRITATPFLRPAFEAQKNAAIEVFAKSLAEGVTAAAKEVARP